MKEELWKAHGMGLTRGPTARHPSLPPFPSYVSLSSSSFAGSPSTHSQGTRRTPSCLMYETLKLLCFIQLLMVWGGTVSLLHCAGVKCQFLSSGVRAIQHPCRLGIPSPGSALPHLCLIPAWQWHG